MQQQLACFKYNKQRKKKRKEDKLYYSLSYHTIFYVFIISFIWLRRFECSCIIIYWQSVKKKYGKHIFFVRIQTYIILWYYYLCLCFFVLLWCMYIYITFFWFWLVLLSIEHVSPQLLNYKLWSVILHSNTMCGGDNSPKMHLSVFASLPKFIRLHLYGWYEPLWFKPPTSSVVIFDDTGKLFGLLSNHRRIRWRIGLNHYGLTYKD